MINKLSGKLSDALSYKLDSTNEEKEVYAYSIEVILSLVLNLIILYETAYIIGKIPELIVFIIFFSGLRTYAGGYHAKTHLECMTLSFTIFFISAMSNTWFIAYGEIIMVILIVSSIFLVFNYAPSESDNKPLNNIKRKRHMIISRVLVILYCVAIIILYYNKSQTNYLYLTAAVAMAIESLSLIKFNIKNFD